MADSDGRSVPEDTVSTPLRVRLGLIPLAEVGPAEDNPATQRGHSVRCRAHSVRYKLRDEADLG